MRWIQTLRGRLIIGSLFLLVILFGVYSYYFINFYRDRMMAQILGSATRVSDFIQSSTHYSMLLNRKEDVYQIMNTIGGQIGVEGIRIYNKRGEIRFSTDSTEKGKSVDLKAEACYGCHDQEKPLESVPAPSRVRIYSRSDGQRLLGLINPIKNEPNCAGASCHPSPEQRKIIGVLDVRMSLAEVDKSLAETQTQIIIVTIVLTFGIAMLSVLFLNITILRPVKELMEGTQRISSGDIDFRIPIGGKDEIGRFATSFNNMMDSLRAAEEKNLEWANTLEQRVQEKTGQITKMHDQIVQIEKMVSLGKLAATVAHEINNPLEGILTYAKLIARRLQKQEQLTPEIINTLEDIELIRRETDRCGTIVNNLLLFSKRQIGELTAAPVQRIVEKAEQLVRHHLQISNVKFSTTYPPKEVPLLCDENQIQQALVALFVNAVEAMPDGGRLSVTVTIDENEEFCTINIHDTGVGILEEDRAKVFEPFFTSKVDGQGVGLGLSVVYGIMERHGGKISVESEVGKGTTVILVFPTYRRSVDQSSINKKDEDKKFSSLD
ncbi:MAG: HAMP domain-containing sensor histidine kinase [bacterium]